MGLVKRAAAAPDASQRRSSGRDTAGLLLQLSTGEPEARRRAALDLEGDVDAVHALLELVGTETDPSVRDAVLTTLAAHDTPDIARAVAVHLGRDDAGLRNAVVVALQAMPTGTAAVVGELLDAPDARTRTLAVMVLSTLAHPEVGTWLRLVAERDTDANIVAAAVDAAQLLDPALAADVATTAARRFPANPYLACLATVAAGNA